MLGKIIAGSTIVAIAALWVLLLSTMPANAGPLGILAVFILMYVVALGLLTFLLYGSGIVMAKFIRTVGDEPIPGLFTLRRAYYYASVVALAPVMLIAMQSVNEVGIYQLLLVMLFVVIAWIYITKRTT